MKEANRKEKPKTCERVSSSICLENQINFEDVCDKYIIVTKPSLSNTTQKHF